MNERIRELAEKSNIMFDPAKESRIHFVSTETLQRFADIIIKNCIFEMMHESTLSHNDQVQDFSVVVANRIKNKFGIGDHKD